MENKPSKENAPPTPVSPVENPRQMDKPNFKQSDEPWKGNTEREQFDPDQPKPDLEKEQEIKTG
jgi:hypothetical protein